MVVQECVTTLGYPGLPVTLHFLKHPREPKRSLFIAFFLILYQKMIIVKIPKSLNFRYHYYCVRSSSVARQLEPLKSPKTELYTPHHLYLCVIPF